MQPFLPRKHIPISVLLAAAVVLGLFTTRDYGESWDEADIYRYSQYATQAYRFFLHPADLPAFDTNLNLYGPAYYVVAGLIANGLMAIHPAWSLINAWHFTYFLTFLAGALVLYLLCTRWMSELAAFGAALLFMTQPLLWGHAFINPKDIPFMAIFTAAIYSGFKMVDGQRASPWINLRLVTAAILLGLTVSFRVVGPLAGLIVLGYAVHRLGRRVLAPAAVYLGIAAVTTYLAWPYLWSAPVAGYMTSLQTMTEFPFVSNILFNGRIYKADQLPGTYFPTFLGIQLTETAVILVCGGIAVSATLFIRKRLTGPFTLFLVWFVLPAALIIAARVPLYDNARQLYFLLPPLFVLAGLCFESLFAMWPRPAIRAAILFLAALPGILLAIRLHPYEYVYYNSLVGGTGGAYRRFETDYWGTSLKEVAEYLDSSAPQGSSVLVFGPDQILKQYLRPDIRIAVPPESPPAAHDFVAMQTRANIDERHCSDTETIYSVGRRGAVFSVLKRIPIGVACN
jgi:hypothetical protein